MYVIEFPFNKILRFILQPAIDLKIHYRYFSGVAGFLKILENVQEKLCYGVPFSKLQVFKLQPPDLPCMFLKFWKIPEKMCAVEFLFTEAGANRFSTRDLSTQF